jgi:glucan phosphoethanolaminetransferase (alkaline phosphatase superfamily)
MIRGLSRWGGVAGLAYVALVVAGHVVAGGPGEAGASNAELLDYYNDSGNQYRVWIGSLLIGVAASAFVVFLVALCTRLSPASAVRPAAVLIAYASGIAFLVVDALGAAIGGAIAAAFVYSNELASFSDTETARVLLVLGNHWLAGLASVLGAPLVVAVSLEARRRALMPSWLAWSGLVLGFLLLLSQLAFVGIPILLWIVAMGIWLLRSPRPETAAA